MKKCILNNLENIIVFLVAIVSTILFVKYGLSHISDIYVNINSTFIGVFGGLLGLLLAAYAIVFGIVPSLNKELLESDSFLRINKAFLIAVLLTLILLVFSITYEFISNPIKDILIIGLFFLFLVVLMEIILITIILFLLLKISRKKILSSS